MSSKAPKNACRRLLLPVALPMMGVVISQPLPVLARMAVATRLRVQGQATTEVGTALSITVLETHVSFSWDYLPVLCH